MFLKLWSKALDVMQSLSLPQLFCIVLLFVSFHFLEGHWGRECNRNWNSIPSERKIMWWVLPKRVYVQQSTLSEKGCFKLYSFWSSDWNLTFHYNFWWKAWQWKFYHGQSFAGLCSVLLEWSSYFIYTCAHLQQSGFHICIILSIIYIQ